MALGRIGLAALLICAAAAVAGDMTGKAVPATAINGLDGKDMSAATARGGWLLITFSDVKSKDPGRAFFRAHAARFTGVDKLALHNVIVPGGVMLAPRGVILARIRSDAAKLESEVRAGLTPAQRAAYDRAAIRWHVDFDRRYSSLFGVPPHRVTLVLVDPAGRVTDVADATGASVDRLLARIQAGR